ASGRKGVSERQDGHGISAARHRVAEMRRAFTVLVGVAVAVAIMPSAGAATVHLPRTSIHVISASPVPSVRRSPAGTVNESARSTDHELRCRATFPSRELEPGLETGARMSVINTTDH